jgi:predicted double-glycine peptidase
MKVLNVPFVQQMDDNSCGAAALEMVYRYFGIKDVSQEEIYEKYKKLEPHNTGNFRLDTESLVADAQNHGFRSDWKKLDLSSKDYVFQALSLLVENDILVIVCQQFTEEDKIIGHFRVVVGVNDGKIILHDPHPKIGGPNLEWSVDKFINLWEETGLNVVGGVYIYIHNKLQP